MSDIITNIPLNQLTAWKGNLNKADIDALAAWIEAHGLLQSFVVRKDGSRFTVIAGNRRLAALMCLLKAGKIKADFEVPCQVIEKDADATEISLAENTMRENMHPADAFEAFRKLIDSGAPLVDVAARFGVTEAFVTQRLKLARVSPVILKAYRNENLTLEQVMAFAVSDDHAAQERVLEDLPPDDSDPRLIRDALTADEIAATDKRVRFVTLKAYEKAGGATRRDLFSDDADGVFILDVDLLDKLAIDKLEKATHSIRKEGWSWVEIHPDFGYEDRSEFHRRYPEPVPLPPEQQARLDSLEQEHETLLDAWRESDDDAERPARLDEIEDLIDQLNDREEVWPSETLAIAGAVVSIGNAGKPIVERGLVRPQDLPKKTSKLKPSSPDDSGQADSGEEQSPVLSAALIESLTAHRSAALSAEMLQRPDIALAAVVYAIASQTFRQCRADSLKVIASPQSFRRVEGSRALERIEAARETWGQKIPGQPEDLWHWCLDQHQDGLLDLLAFCAACTLDAVQMKADTADSSRLQHGRQLAAALGLDMKAWFTPGAENYFSRVSKPHILAAIQEAKGQPAAPAWEKLKKADLAKEAERQIAGTGWLPGPLR